MTDVFILKNNTVRRNAIEAIGALYIPEKPSHEVIIREVQRSSNQNRLYWKWLKIIGNALGCTDDDMHDAFKRHFLGEVITRDRFGRVRERPKSSAKLKKSEFMEYMNKVAIYAESEGVRLPSPDYYGYEDISG